MGDQITPEDDTPREIDPMLERLRQMIIDTQIDPTSGADLTDFTEKNTIIVPPEAEDSWILESIEAACAKAKGLALVIVVGGGKNPDPEAPGPVCTIELELQLYVDLAMRKKGARTVAELRTALMRHLHDAQIRALGFPWYEEMRWLGFDPIPDDDYLAWSIKFEREMIF